MDIKGIAEDAIKEAIAEDAKMSLEEHDRKYHHGHYTPDQDCEVREMMALGDDSDATINLASQAEGSRRKAKDDEQDMIRRAFEIMIPIVKSLAARKKFGSEVVVGDQDKNGDVKVMISAFPVVPNEAITEDMVRQIVEGHGGNKRNALYSYEGDSQSREDQIRRVMGLGYKLKDFQVKTLRGNNVKNGGKKMFIIKMHKDAKVGELSTDMKQRLEFLRKVAKNHSQEKPMTEAEKSLALKRYGLKMEDGKVKPRISREEETPVERYLRLVGIGATVPKTNAEIKKQNEIKEAVQKKERKDFLDELGLMGDDFFKKLG